MDKPASLIATASVKVTVDLDVLADSFQAIADAVRVVESVEGAQSTSAVNELKESNMSTATKYRKRPVVIEAMGPLTAENSDDIAQWCGGHEAPANTPTSYPIHFDGDLIIPTLEGPMLARLGDFIIRGIQNEFYPCEAVIFGATYEQVTS